MADRQPRMIVSTEGMESSGKTDWALSAPRPLTLLDFDYGTEGVRQPAPDTHIRYDLAAAEWMDEAPARRHMQAEMRRFVEDWRKAFAGKVRTLVVDTFTRAWSTQRVAHPEDKYAALEEEFLSLIGMAYASPHTNLILIHHMKKDWKRTQDGKSYPSGTWSRDGMDGILTKVQLGIRQRYVAPVPAQMAGEYITKPAVPGQFAIDVLKSRDNIGLTGETFPGMSFAELCGVVVPTVDWSK